MRPADDIKHLIHQSQITSSEQVDRRILADALADLESRRASSNARPGVWRILMHSKPFKLAAAADHLVDTDRRGNLAAHGIYWRRHHWLVYRSL